VAGPLEGDPQQQAGALLLDARGTLRWIHRSRSLGDHPPLGRVVAAALEAWASAHPEVA
jgi:hypothetical protein